MVFQTEILETSLLHLWRASFVIFLIAAAEETGGDSWKYSLRVSTDERKIDREKGNASVSFFFFATVTLSRE